MPSEPSPRPARVAAPSMDAIRALANRRLDPAHKAALGQFMTPSRVAAFMAELFGAWERPELHLLDAGAGVGSLSAAFLDAWLARPAGPARVTCYEVDPVMRGFLARTLDAYEHAARARSRDLRGAIVEHDFIAAGAHDLSLAPRFTHAILNPPYKKIGRDSPARRALRDVGVEVVNLYTAFLALALALLSEGGELVAIVPRSFCNGPYYRPFRAYFRERAALTHLHLFERRDHAFKDDEVLQENVIVKWVRGAPQGEVTVSWCRDAAFSDLRRERLPFSAVVRPGDPEAFIHVPLAPAAPEPPQACSLEELGLAVSTGPVVDFRLREHLRPRPEPGAVPLLYPQHFARGGLRYPGVGKKPSAILLNDATRRWLLPRGWYVVTRRFTSKEEPRRVVAHVLDPAALPGELLGLENHLNVFHRGRAGLGPDLARGLALFLNSARVDRSFRSFSGHTQVNATDLRSLRYPPRKQLEALGRWARARGAAAPHEIDARLDELADLKTLRRA